jgi:hypothetical protein
MQTLANISIARKTMIAIVAASIATAADTASATTCSSLLAPNNTGGFTPFSMAFTTSDARFTGFMTSSFTTDGTYLLATRLDQLFSDRLGDECSGGLCLPTQPFDHKQPGPNFAVYLQLADAMLWVWNGGAWEGPFAPINDCNTGMLYYAGTDYGFSGMYQIGLGPHISSPK